MNIENIVEFLSLNKKFFWCEDLQKIKNWQICEIFEKFTEFYNNEKDKNLKIELWKIIYFLYELNINIKKNKYKYCYLNCEKVEHFNDWFKYYLENWMLNNANNVIKEIEDKFWNKQLVIKLRTKLEVQKKNYSKKFEKLKLDYIWIKIRNFTNNLILNWKYSKLKSELFELNETLKNKKIFEKYLKIVDKFNSIDFTKLRTYWIDQFNKYWLEEFYKNNNISKIEFLHVYKKLDQIIKDWDFEFWVWFIRYLSNYYKNDDVMLLNYLEICLKKKFLKDYNQQLSNYNLEVKTLENYIISWLEKEAVAKANSILTRYPFIDKKYIYIILKNLENSKKNIRLKIKTIFYNIEKYLFYFLPFNKNWLLIFYDSIQWFLKSKVNIKTAIEIIYHQSINIWMKRFIKSLIEWLEAWHNFSDILSNEKIISKLDITLIKIWETTWKLWEIFEMLYNINYEKQLRENKLMSIFIYPSIVISLSIIIFSWMLIYIVPNFIEFYWNLWIKLPFITSLLISFSYFLTNNFYWVIFGLTIWFILTKYFFWSVYWNYILSYLAIKLPIIKNIEEKKNLILFCTNIWLLLKSWINIIQAMNILIYWTKNYFYKKEFERIKIELEIWNSLSKALWLTKTHSSNLINNNKIISLLSIDFIYSLNVWEKTWNLSQILLQLKDRYENELKNKLNYLNNFIEPALILFVWIIIFILVLAVFLPLINIYNYIWTY